MFNDANSFEGNAKPAGTREAALAVLKRLRDCGHVAYFAGGCVRDLLLGREPKDWDVATDAPPNRVRALFHNTQSVGAAFGVILVRHQGSVVEVATFRAEGPYEDGRHPAAVRFTTAEEDAKRRDFTINGLFLDPLREGSLDAQVIDYVAGREDVPARRIRAIGDADARFNEDHLRMLRAVRFAGRLGFGVEPATADAIVRHAPRLIRISPERIADELRAMLTPSTRVAAYRLLEELGLRRPVFRFLNVPTGPGRLDRSISIFNLLSPGTAIPFPLALAAMGIDHWLWLGLADLDPRTLFTRSGAQKIERALRQSLKLSNEESQSLEESLDGLEPLLLPVAPPVAAMKRFLARRTAPLSRELLGAAGQLNLLDAGRVEFLQSRLQELEKTEFAPAPLITGTDLMAAGLSPGPVFKKVLDAVYDAQLENRVQTRESALRLALEIAAT